MSNPNIKPAPKGNKYAVGNKGGGRLSVKEEEWHVWLWTNDQMVRELEAKIASGKYSGRDVYALKVLKADTTILRNLADKVLANLVDIRGKDGKDLFIRKDEVVASVSNLIEEDENT